MNIYDQQPPISATTKTLREYITYLCLDARELTPEEREANNVPDTVIDDQGNEVPKEAWTAHTVAYHHEQPLSADDYSPIVTAIIRSKYTSSDMEAITSNYLRETDLAKLIDLLRTTQNFNKLRSTMSDWLSGRDADIVEEYDRMQIWREKAKEAARIAVGIA